MTWSTFDRELHHSPRSFLQPASRDEVLAIVRSASLSNQTVKVVGSGHSWSPLGLTDGVMLNLDRMNRVLSIDAEARLVTAEAGIRIRELSER